MAFEELQVPEKEGVWICARHKTVETRLRCGRCEKPICPKCTVYGPTGTRCRDCLSNRGSHLYQIAPRQAALAFGASVVLGALGAALTQAVGVFWFWVLLYAPAIGPLWGRAMVKISGGKRGSKLALIVSAGIIVGALAGAVAMTWFFYSRAMGPALAELPPEVAAKARQNMGKVSLSAPFLMMMALANLPLWAFIVIAIVGVWWWLK
ncbi:MAG: hypothetical protein KY445_08145 [Armatimonadetes bacterium]|nr:hypothetical protein [Armatimonadota bacterium]